MLGSFWLKSLLAVETYMHFSFFYLAICIMIDLNFELTKLIYFMVTVCM